MPSPAFTHEWYLHLLPFARLDGPTSVERTRQLADAARALDGETLEVSEAFSLAQALRRHAPDGRLDALARPEELDRLAGALFELALRLGFRIVAHHAPVEPLLASDGRAFSCAATLAGGQDLVVSPTEGPVRLGAGLERGVLRLTVSAAAPATVWTRLEAAPDRVLDGRVREVRVRRLLVDAASGRTLGFDEVTVRRGLLPRPLLAGRSAA